MYFQYREELQTNNSLRQSLTQTQLNNDFASYYNKFGNVSLTSRSYNFSPPITMYHALRIAFESDGWNASSLSNMTVRVWLEYGSFFSNSSSSGGGPLQEVTQPATDYSPVYIGYTNTAYRYIWLIQVDDSAYLGVFHTPPQGLYFIDAATGEIIPHAPLY